MPQTVAVTDDRFGSYDEENAVFEAADVDLEVFELTIESSIPEALLEADGILCNLFPISAALIERLRKCRIISRYGVGYDNVDLEAATRRGIWVANVPDYSVEDVSDHAFALMLACSRKIVPLHKAVLEGCWNLKGQYGMRRIRGKTLGIIGYGRIGRALHGKAAGLGLSDVLVYDPCVGAVDVQGAHSVSLEQLLSRSDFVSIHVPLIQDTLHLISASELAAMKETSILINTSRGKVIDEAALARTLASRPLMFAGIDVFEEEPLSRESPLRKLDNVILSPHIAYYSEESISELKTKAAANVLEVLRGRPPVYPVNKV